jgi:hypothetical protein
MHRQSAAQSPGPSLEIELVRDERDGLDAADDDRHERRYARDGYVVVELAYRVHEGPLICTEHQDAVGGIDKRHPGGEERREHQNGRERNAVRRLGARHTQSVTSVAVSKPRPNKKPRKNICRL